MAIPTAGADRSRATPPIGGRLALFADAWAKLTTDAWVLNTIRFGLRLEFLSIPLNHFRTFTAAKSKDKRKLMRQAIQHLLDIRAVGLVAPGQVEITGDSRWYPLKPF